MDMLSPMFSSEGSSPTITLEYKEIMQAITALTSCRKILAKAADTVQWGAFVSTTLSEQLATAWYRINVCRLFTQEDVNWEGHLQSAMGLINDAKSMVDSLAAWGKGVTRAGRANILLCLAIATDEVFTVQEQLECMLGNECSHKKSR